MPHTRRKRYAVVSCHVERPLDAALWARFAALQDARPAGFVIAALMRPVDAAFGEDNEALWLRRAREADARAPLGHHTHWTAPEHARPGSPVTISHRQGESARQQADPEPATDRYKTPGDRVRAEGRRLREQGLRPTIFCGGGWYTDEAVADACAELGYVDCTPRASRPRYLAEGERWASLSDPATVELSSGRELLAIPTTHSLGELMRAVLGRRLPELVHVYFHDTDLLDVRRRALLRAGLALLAKRAQPTDLDALAAWGLPDRPRVAWADVARL
jgi:hypothetical protein